MVRIIFCVWTTEYGTSIFFSEHFAPEDTVMFGLYLVMLVCGGWQQQC